MPRAWLLVLLACACGVPAAAPAHLPDSSATTWVFVIHGSGDGPDSWPNEMIGTLKSVADPVTSMNVPDTEFVAWDWQEAARDKLTAAERGQAEGAAIAEALQSTKVKHLHVIAHSAGAHVALGLEEAIAQWPEQPVIHLTLLDPFLGKGLDFAWGRSRMGAHSDYVEQWMNVGDGVPGTDFTVDAAHVFDVTHMAGKPMFTDSRAHWWPISTYQSQGLWDRGLRRSREVSGHFDAAALRAEFPPGVTEVVP